MKRFIVIFYCGIIALPVFSQKNKELEPAILECHYKLRGLKDTVKNVPFREDDVILRIGKSMAQEFSSHKYYGDSLISVPGGTQILGKLMAERIRKRDYQNIPGARIMGNYLYKDYPQGKITTTTSVDGVDNLIFEEEYEAQNWTIRDSTKLIMDYQCQLAECDFRGRRYHAWFTPEIPLNNGPWKFKGLPGLIMELYDLQMHYHYELVGIRRENLQPVTFYKLSKSKPAKTTRVEYLRALSKYRANMLQSIKASTGIDLNPENKPVESRAFYDSMEKDY